MKAKKLFNLFFISLIALFVISCNGNNTERKRTKGYSSDPDFTPTMDDRGEYNNAGTGEKQIQYQGSSQQQNDLNAIDEYARTHPDF